MIVLETVEITGKKMTELEMAALPPPLTMLIGPHYILNEGLICRIKTKKNMQVLTIKDGWKDIDQTKPFCYPEEHEIRAINKKRVPVNEFCDKVDTLFDLNNKKPYHRYTIIFTKLPVVLIQSKDKLLAWEKILSEITSRVYSSIISFDCYFRLTRFYAIRIIDKEGYIKELRREITFREKAIREIDES